jgi:PIN domain nuclease of toxin-antitoxin system
MAISFWEIKKRKERKKLNFYLKMKEIKKIRKNINNINLLCFLLPRKNNRM